MIDRRAPETSVAVSHTSAGGWLNWFPVGQAGADLHPGELRGGGESVGGRFPQRTSLSAAGPQSTIQRRGCAPTGSCCKSHSSMRLAAGDVTAPGPVPGGLVPSSFL